MSEQTAPEGEGRQWTLHGGEWVGEGQDRCFALPSIDPRLSVGESVEVAPLARALRAEAAAREFAETLAEGAVHNFKEGPNAGWRDIEGDLRYDDDLRCRSDCPVCSVLARHPGFVPPPGVSVSEQTAPKGEELRVYVPGVDEFERANEAARDFATALLEINENAVIPEYTTLSEWAYQALARHPGFLPTNKGRTSPEGQASDPMTPSPDLPEQVRSYIMSISDTLEGIHELAPEVPEQLGPVLDELQQAARLVERAYERMSY